MCEVGTRPALAGGDRGGEETPPASALSPPSFGAGDKCREMGEQPIFTTRAHVFQIDPTTKKNWVPASKQAVTVSYFYDGTRNSYRIISVDGTKRQRMEAFELWCWRRLLRVPWTAKRSNRSVLEEIDPDCSLEGQILKMKLKSFGHLMRRKDSLEKNLMLGTIEGKRRRGRQRMRWLDGVTEAVGVS